MISGTFPFFGTPPVKINILAYGPPSSGPNVFTINSGLEFKGPDSVIGPLEGSGGLARLSLSASIGDVKIESKIHDEASGWDASGVDFTYTTPSSTIPAPRHFEANSPDFDGIWFDDSPCIKPWGSLKVECFALASVQCDPFTLSDFEVNTGVCCAGSDEAVYVDGDLIMTGFLNRVDMNGLNLYYTGTLDVNCPSITFLNNECPTSVEKTLYGDFDGDCQITPLELFLLRRRINGVDPYDALFDFDCDGVINSTVELSRFMINLSQQPECGQENATGGGGSQMASGGLGVGVAQVDGPAEADPLRDWRPGWRVL